MTSSPCAALGWLPINQAEEQEVTAFKHFEREKLHKSLDEYIRMCTLANVLISSHLALQCSHKLRFWGT